MKKMMWNDISEIVGFKTFTFLFIFSLLFRCESNTNPEYFNKFNDYKGFSANQARSIHNNFDYDLHTYIEGGGGDHSRYIFLNTSEFFFQTTINKAIETKPLSLDLNDELGSFIVESKLGSLTLNEYVNKAPVDGIIILHKGKVVYEDYPRMYWDDKHIWFSVTKTLVGTAIAILEDREMINTQSSLNDYLDELKDTDWEGIPIRDIMDMTSGMDTKDDFKYDSNFLLFFRNFGGFTNHLEPGSSNPINFLKTIKKLKDSGEKFEYSTINTELLAWVVERITGERVSDFIEREIWQKTGAEFEARMIMTRNGDCFTGAGMNSTLRDLARYGLLFTPSGRTSERPVISNRYLAQIQTNHNKSLKAKAWFSDALTYNSYQWDNIYEDGDFYKHGHNGQGLYISTSNDVVIAFFGTMTTSREEHQLPLIARQLMKSEIFK